MGCCPTKVSQSAAAGAAEVAVDPQTVELKKLILNRPDLKKMVEQYNSNLPRITKALSDLTCRLDNALPATDSSRAAFLAYRREMENRMQNKRKKGQKKKRKHTEDVFAKVAAELDKLKLATENLEAQELLSALGDLNNTMEWFSARKAAIEKRMRSAKRWRKVCSAAFTAAFIGAMLAIVGLAVAGMPPMAISVATAVATVVKAVEPWINTAWDEKEKELKDEKEIVEEMFEGSLLARELQSVRPTLKKVRINSTRWPNYVDFVLREENEDALAVVVSLVAEMEKMSGEVESAILHLKGKANEWADEIQRAQSKLNKILRD